MYMYFNKHIVTMIPKLFHKLSHHVKSPSSKFYVNPVDVKKVISFDKRKRIFCIFNREYPYELDIEYFNPRHVRAPNFAITTGPGIGVAFGEKYEEISTMSIRYKTEREILNDIYEIEKKQKFLEEFEKREIEKFAVFANKQIKQIEQKNN